MKSMQRVGWVSVGWVSAVPGTPNDTPQRRRVTHHSRAVRGTVGYAADTVPAEPPCVEWVSAVTGTSNDTLHHRRGTHRSKAVPWTVGYAADTLCWPNRRAAKRR
jgi:hypothetical protein